MAVVAEAAAIEAAKKLGFFMVMVGSDRVKKRRVFWRKGARENCVGN